MAVFTHFTGLTALERLRSGASNHETVDLAALLGQVKKHAPAWFKPELGLQWMDERGNWTVYVGYGNFEETKDVSLKTDIGVIALVRARGTFYFVDLVKLADPVRYWYYTTALINDQLIDADNKLICNLSERSKAQMMIQNTPSEGK